MKNTIYILLLSLTIFSCDDYLDIETKGFQVPKTVDHLGDMMNTGSQTGSSAMGGARMQMMKSDNVYLPDQWNLWTLYMYQFDPKVEELLYDDTEFATLYRTIYYSNFVLENVDSFEEGKQWNRDEVKGIALYNRAAAYLILVNNYAAHYTEGSEEFGVPYVTSTLLDQDFPLEKVTVIYEAIVEDLKGSIELLKPDRIGPVLPGKMAAYTILSRAYLYMGDYENAKIVAGEALALDSSLEDFKSAPGYWQSRDYGDVLQYKDSGAKLYYGSLQPAQDLLDLYDPLTDARYNKYIADYGDWGIYFNYAAPANIGASMGELYLNYIEACLRTDDRSSAEPKLDSFLDARYFVAPVYADMDDDQLLDFILDERRREMTNSGMRVYDIKRLNALHNANITVTHIYQDKIYTCEPSSDQLILPLPPQEVLINNWGEE